MKIRFIGLGLLFLLLVAGWFIFWPPAPALEHSSRMAEAGKPDEPSTVDSPVTSDALTDNRVGGSPISSRSGSRGTIPAQTSTGSSGQPDSSSASGRGSRAPLRFSPARLTHSGADAVAAALAKAFAGLTPMDLESMQAGDNQVLPFAPEVMLARHQAFLRSLPSAEAVVLEEVTDGVVTTPRESYWQLATTAEKLDFLRDQVAENGLLSSTDVLALFQNEKDAAVRLELLTAATLPAYDANIQTLYSLALRADQPADVRLAALAYAAEADKSFATAHLNDPDPEVRLTAASILNALPGPQTPPTSN